MTNHTCSVLLKHPTPPPTLLSICILDLIPLKKIEVIKRVLPQAPPHLPIYLHLCPLPWLLLMCMHKQAIMASIFKRTFLDSSGQKPWSYSFSFFLTSHITSISKYYWFYLHYISRIWLLLTSATASTLFQATIISHLLQISSIFTMATWWKHHSYVSRMLSRDLILSAVHILGTRIHFYVNWEIPPKAMKFWPLHALFFQ